MKLWDLYQLGAAELSENMDEGTASFETYCLLEHLFGWNRHDVQLCRDFPVAELMEERFRSLLERRKSGYPLQYLLGSWEFWGYEFAVGEGVLIPRADTETLCEAVLEAAKEFDSPVIADLCSGSGCLPVVFSKEIPKAERIYAVELSEDALPYLKKNVELNDCKNLTVLHQDVLTWIPQEPLHIISSNPPYLSYEEMEELQTEVTYEPKMALEAPENGLYFYRVLSDRYREFLVDGGVLAFEVGWTQAEAVANLMKQFGYSDLRILRDLPGNERVVIGRFYKAQEA